MKDLAPAYRNNSLTLDDIRQLTAYLLELKPVAADAVIEPVSGGGSAVERGAATFTANCAGCHSTGDNRIAGPGLAGISSRGDDDYIRESIVDPTAIVVEGFPPIMPACFGTTLSVDELEDLIVYLKSL